MANKKKTDSLCFDISNLNQDQKVKFAKSLKTSVDNFNKNVESDNEEITDEE